MRTRRLPFGCILVVLLGLCCGSEPKPRGRVLLVGIDGAMLRVAVPLLRAGRLPNLAAVAQQGVYGPLWSQMPLLSPRIWTSIATGKTPKHHGIMNFAHDDDAGRQHLYGSADRKGPALWNIVSEAGLTVSVVNWWMTYPLETIRGVMVSDHLLAREIQGRRNLTGALSPEGGPIVYPEAWEEPVRTLANETRPLTEVPNPFADPKGFPDWVVPADLAKHYENDTWVTRIALEIERREHPDVQMVFLPGIDRVSHILWGAIEPDSAYPRRMFTSAEREVAANALRRYYEYTDGLIGTLLESFGPDDLVIVVSDHGFEAGTGDMPGVTGVHDSPRALLGVLFARGSAVEPPSDSSTRVSVNDVTPTILAWLGLPIADDMDGKPAPFLAIDPAKIARVPTYDTAVIERRGDEPSGAEEAILENLRALGYLERGDAQ
jgi:predicted AlkP superfamily phosphohydrolase/phosphomutase